MGNIKDEIKIRMKGTNIESTAWPDVRIPYYWYYDEKGEIKYEHRNKLFDVWEQVEPAKEDKEK